MQTPTSFRPADEAFPSNFDPLRYPVLAQHWFGVIPLLPVRDPDELEAVDERSAAA